MSRVDEQLGINPEMLPSWVNQARVGAGDRPGTTVGDGQRLADLEREDRDLRRSSAILRSPAAFFAGA
ncbi:transposase [Oerskovia sp. NPDC060338]|uniref:transposase n=1 Tax=Oerskovia sp. NPDC060338 TaxID=3347100 RepID=UPI00365166D4